MDILSKIFYINVQSIFSIKASKMSINCVTRAVNHIRHGIPVHYVSYELKQESKFIKHLVQQTHTTTPYPHQMFSKKYFFPFKKCQKSFNFFLKLYLIRFVIFYDLSQNYWTKISSAARIFQVGLHDFLFVKKSLKYSLCIKFLHFLSVT